LILGVKNMKGGIIIIVFFFTNRLVRREKKDYLKGKKIIREKNPIVRRTERQRQF